MLVKIYKGKVYVTFYTKISSLIKIPNRAYLFMVNIKGLLLIVHKIMQFLGSSGYKKRLGGIKMQVIISNYLAKRYTIIYIA